jgi:sulfur carrier protein
MAMSEPTTITLNGSPHPLDAAVSIEALLARLGLAGKPVVVELDEQAVFPRDYPQTQVKPGARVEIVALAAGG